MNKPKNPQKENLDEVSGRDLFQTPNYATKLLLPFLDELFLEPPYYSRFHVWECAAGQGKMVRVLEEPGFTVLATDLAYEDEYKRNFLTDKISFRFDCIVTNPPFSLKRKFFQKCLEYEKPFALLIPADYTGWLIEAVDKHGCEKIIPTRRIDYITPNILKNIARGETFKRMDTSLQEIFEKPANVPDEHIIPEFVFPSIYECPQELLREYSSSYHHSMWLTWGLGLGKTETFVELTNEMKKDI